VAIVPFFIATGLDLRFMRLARTFRVFRVLKFARYSQALALIARVLRRRREELIVALGVILLLVVAASSLMYFAEHEAQPAAFSSIPQTMWWAVMTITTVGYGDVYPVTHVGRLLASMIALLGIGSFALPTSILGAGFLEEVARPPQSKTCPKCGATV
jgi:voltage-gated potassium channel